MFSLIEWFGNDGAVLLQSAADISLKVLLVAVLVFIAMKALRMKDSSVQHRAYALVLASMLAMPAFSLLAPQWEIPISTTRLFQEISAGSKSNDGLVIVSPNNDAVLSSWGSQNFLDSGYVGSTKPTPLGSETPVAEHSAKEHRAIEMLPPLEAAPSEPTMKAKWAPSWATILIATYLVGLCILLLRIFFGIAKCRLLLRKARSVQFQDATLASITSTPVLESNELQVPVAIGIWRPKIVLPADWRNWSNHEVAMALTHEAEHIRRRDTWTALLAAFNCAIYWFHPVSWILAFRLADLAEHACDDAVIAEVGDRADYASKLVGLASRLTSEAPRYRPTYVGMARQTSVEKRVLRIIDEKRTLSKRVSWLKGSALALAILTVAVIAAGISLTNQTVIADEPSNAGVQTSSLQSDDKGNEQVQEKAVPQPPANAGADEPNSDLANSEMPLSGRIVDDLGKPVTDASVTLRGGGNGRDRYEAKTDTNGEYAFPTIETDGLYRMLIKSKRWVGLTHLKEGILIQLSPTGKIVRDMTLQRACLVRVRVVDSQNKPIHRAHLYVKNLGADRFSSSRRSVSTGKDGWAEIGGLPPSPAGYRIGVSSSRHAVAMVDVKLSEVGQVVESVVSLPDGVEVKGVAICSDDKPAAGWRITALPDWWGDFGSSPGGVEIGKNGEFALPNITTGKYNVSINVPIGAGLSRTVPVLSDKALLPVDELLRVKIDSPSPGGMGTIRGKLVFKEDATPKGTIRISATHEDNNLYAGSAHLAPGKTDFSIEALPPGKYRIQIESPEIETVNLRYIGAPRDGLEVSVEVKGRPRIVGNVIDSAGAPITTFKVRVTKLASLRGPNYVQEPEWIGVNDPKGNFAVDVVGPGIYRVTAAVDGLSLATSGPLNTDELPDAPVTLKLTEGVTLRGTVVDEAGQPVDGATVAPRSASPSVMPHFAKAFAGEQGSVKTVNGKFELTDLPVGRELVRVTHPDFAIELSEEITLDDADIELPLIILEPGGAVSGTVYDADGKPRGGVKVMFHDSAGYSGDVDQQVGELAAAITDEMGRYKVEHLPERLCHVHLQQEWKSLGVVRSAILPANGIERTLDFGGPGGVTGRLLNNGTPVANVRIQLGGENANSGLFRALARTDAQGRFTFGRIPAGRRTLRFQPDGKGSDWQRVTEVESPASAKPGETINLGDLDYRTVKLTVSVTGLTARESKAANVTLYRHDPDSFMGHLVGNSISRRAPEPPAVFRDVPIGKADVRVYRHDGVILSKTIDVNQDKTSQEITVNWPNKTGTLEVNVAESFCDGSECNLPGLRSADGSIIAELRPNPTGENLRLERLPVGDYFLTYDGIRDAAHLIDFKISDGETTEINVTEENCKPATGQNGAASIGWFGSDGIPLVGVDATITDKSGKELVSIIKGREASGLYFGPPGEYEVVGEFPGYARLRKVITLEPLRLDPFRTEGSRLVVPTIDILMDAAE